MTLTLAETTLRAALVRLNPRRPIGAGFVVAPNRILTCAHCVKGESVELDWPLLPDHPQCSARVVQRDEDADLALLEVPDLPLGAAPITLSSIDSVWQHPFRAFGFPQGHPDGVWATGRLLSANAAGWVMLEDIKETGKRVEPGFSGGPVWDDEAGGVAGMVVASDRDPAAKVAFMIPAALLVEHFKWPTWRNVTQVNTKRVELILEGDYKELSPQRQQDIIGVLAALLKIEATKIRILQVYQGSIIMMLEMPEDAANRIYEMALTVEIELVRLGVKSVSVEGKEAIKIEITGRPNQIINRRSPAQAFDPILEEARALPDTDVTGTTQKLEAESYKEKQFDETSLKEDPPDTLPFLLRFILWAGGPVGFAFAPDQHVRVIYHMGRYRGVRGPGLFRYEVFVSESLGPLVYVGPQTMTFAFTQLLTRDSLALTAQVQVTACYDPRAAPTFAPNLTGVSPKTRESVVQSYLIGACLSIFNQHSAEQMTQQAQRTRLEFEITARFTKEIGPLGFALPSGQRVRLLTVELPPRIAERHELIAQRHLNISAAIEMLPEDLRRTLILEVLKNLGELGGGNAHISFNDVLNNYIAEHPDTVGRFIERRH